MENEEFLTAENEEIFPAKCQTIRDRRANLIFFVVTTAKDIHIPAACELIPAARSRKEKSRVRSVKACVLSPASPIYSDPVLLQGPKAELAAVATANVQAPEKAEVRPSAHEEPAAQRIAGRDEHLEPLPRELRRRRAGRRAAEPAAAHVESPEGRVVVEGLGEDLQGWDT